MIMIENKISSKDDTSEINSNFYSQYAQDECINELFKKRKKGVFLDIGAHDGITFSNTLFFENVKGWMGICIEPNPDVFSKLQENRHCILENCCITNEDKDVIFRQVKGDVQLEMLSGILDFFDQKHIDRINSAIKNNGIYVDISIKAKRLNNILIEHNMTNIDYCSIDTEGAELLILQSIDFEKIRITTFTIENNNKEKAIRRFLATKGYHCIPGRLDDYYVKKGTPRIFQFFIKIKIVWIFSTVKIAGQKIQMLLQR
jgi:FkbM family methyltransferase